MTLIELDRPVTPVARPPARTYRGLGLVVALALAWTLGGAGAGPVPLWRSVGTFELTGSDASFALAGDRLYTLGAVGGRRTAGAWSLSGAGYLWQVEVPRDRLEISADAGPYVLVSSGTATTVLDAASGAVRWSSPAGVLPIGAGTGLIRSTEFAPGTGWCRNSSSVRSSHIR